MRALPPFLALLALAAADDLVTTMGASKIDGRVQSLLVGGHDVATVLRRDDYWNCRFFDNYDCIETDDCLTIPRRSE
ncbi:hypothetical protein SNOG_13496 [Parastagonospora nodorum SN15]|uniref:Uncharacterized protein n=1 Tax=Phaeosphaeria nodorum (strain SN15 / ATCC MYA-4574 / FGSC 10173) TaxID=321614 RepID=Q0U418_PHANO|nr:hypothetical protein SNOG_13496 [Parastagonospora nodorum SN15]EAT78943.1 hypothetical protein SNOG_13496 [Parastagonospora nodorum SN15]